MKNGLIFEHDHLVYYKNDKRYHAGVVKVDGDIYYISKGGRAVKGEHIVHGEMANGILKRGTYTFGDDYKLIKGSYIAPKTKKKSSKKSKSKKSNKNKKKIIISAGIVAVLLIVAVILQLIFRSANNIDISSSDFNNSSISLPKYDEEILLCSEKAKELYDNEITVETAVKGGNPYRPFTFEYSIEDRDGKLIVSENEDFYDCLEYNLSSNANQIVIDNLKTDTKYYYQVLVDDETYEGEFKTAASTRFINISGMYNARDIGGYTTLDGKIIKQGLIIRGTEIDGLVEPKYFVEGEEVNYLNDTFGFVCDFDLREEGIFDGDYVSKINNDSNHKFYDAPAYGLIFSEDGSEKLKEIFSDFAKPENYPMYLHCTYGADRTGTMVFLLQGLLNMSEDDLLREYKMTGFHLPEFATANSMNVVLENLKVYKGDTISEKIESYLISIGITKQEIQSIRNIFLEN